MDIRTDLVVQVCLWQGLLPNTRLASRQFALPLRLLNMRSEKLEHATKIPFLRYKQLLHAPYTRVDIRKGSREMVIKG